MNDLYFTVVNIVYGIYYIDCYLYNVRKVSGYKKKRTENLKRYFKPTFNFID